MYEVYTPYAYIYIAAVRTAGYQYHCKPSDRKHCKAQGHARYPETLGFGTGVRLLDFFNA